MKIIGRKREKDELMQRLMSKRPEFVVYGSRRVGKNYLVREFFNKYFLLSCVEIYLLTRWVIVC